MGTTTKKERNEETEEEIEENGKEEDKNMPEKITEARKPTQT